MKITQQFKSSWHQVSGNESDFNNETLAQISCLSGSELPFVRSKFSPRDLDHITSLTLYHTF